MDYEDDEEEPGTNFFIISWDMTGLECIVDAGEMVSNAVMDALKSDGPTPNELGGIVSRLKLRAQYNLQRHYEIYSIHTAKSIGKEDLEYMFEQSPQAAAELIRNRGVKIYCNRIKEGATIIR